MPAREREQENDAPKYKGAAIPSRSFKYLQSWTQEEEDKQAKRTSESITNNMSQSTNIESAIGNRRGSKTQISELQSQPVSQKFETRSEAFIKKFEPNRESTEQRIETRSEEVSQSIEPRSESLVKKFESSSKSVLTTTTTSNLMTGMFYHSEF